MKILLVNSNMGYGGAEKVMAFLANRVSCEGDKVYLLTYENSNVMQKLVPEVNQLHLTYSPPPVFVVRRIFQIVQIRRVLNRIKPNIIISFLTYPNLLSIIASMGTRIPVIISERCNPYLNKGWFTQLRDFIYGFADGYVFQTHKAKNYFNQRIREKATVIPNPVIAADETDIWMGNREDVIVHIGRFELKQKRQDILIKAFYRIADKYPEMMLTFYGDGEDEIAIRQIISKYKLENRVVLAGVSRNVCESIKKARMFVLSSDYEGIPNALIEAMTVGLPCVVTDYTPGGATELIRNMENGVLVKAGCEAELATAMDFMLANPKAAELMGRNARKIIFDYHPDRIFSQWKSYINTIVNEF